MRFFPSFTSSKSLTLLSLTREVAFNLTGTTVSGANTFMTQPLQNLCVGATYQFSLYVGIISIPAARNPYFSVILGDTTTPYGEGTIDLFTTSGTDPCPANACIPPGQTYGYSNFQAPFTYSNNDSLTLELYTLAKTPKVAYNPLLYDLITLTLTALPVSQG